MRGREQITAIVHYITTSRFDDLHHFTVAFDMFE